MTRPERLVGVVGTGTEVGKTWVTTRLVEQLRREGRSAVARKPAQSFDPGERTDAEVLAHASGDRPDAVCPAHRWYPLAMAPPMAAEALGRERFTISDLVGELTWPQAVDVGLVETAGGVRSPLADDGDAVTLVARLRPDIVVLVADAGLGTINLVRLSAAALDCFRLLVHLNRFEPDDELHRRNEEWLQRDGFAVETAIAATAARLSREC